ncbi:MAG TPA: hypothetical protein VF011_07110 [Terriglobales bacterium]
MPGHRQPRPTGSYTANVEDGTLCRVPCPTPGPLGAQRPSRAQTRRLKVLGFDGAKVHEFLFHVALSEVEWQDLSVNPNAKPDHEAQKEKANDRASMLYDQFLEACTQGPQQATAFLGKQREIQKQYLSKSKAILHSMQLKVAGRQVLLSEVAFGAQLVKSGATAGVAIIGLLLAGPEIVAGAGIAIAFDVTMELINHLGPSGQNNADTVIVGFKQTVANDSVGLAGSVKQVSLEESNRALEKTLRYPLKSSVYRTTAATVGRVDILLKGLSWLAAGVTMYTEFDASKASYEEMQRTKEAYSSIR